LSGVSNSFVIDVTRLTESTIRQQKYKVIMNNDYNKGRVGAENSRAGVAWPTHSTRGLELIGDHGHQKRGAE